MLTDEQRHAIVQERLAGAGIVSLMRKYRLAHPKLRRILAEAGAMPEFAKAVAGRPPAPFGCGSYDRDIEARERARQARLRPPPLPWKVRGGAGVAQGAAYGLPGEPADEACSR